MTVLAGITFAAGVDIVDRMTARTASWRRRKQVVSMAIAAFDNRMSTRQRVAGQRVIKRGFVPTGRCVAAVTLLAETALMLIVVRMAVVAAGRRIPVFIAIGVTVGAAGAQVRIRQCEVGPAMIEQAVMNRDDIGLPAFMIGMAGHAFVALRGRETTVKSGHRSAIDANILVTAHAQRRNRLIRARVVARDALALELGMAFNHAARHQ